MQEYRNLKERPKIFDAFTELRCNDHASFDAKFNKNRKKSMMHNLLDLDTYLQQFFIISSHTKIDAKKFNE